MNSQQPWLKKDSLCFCHANSLPDLWFTLRGVAGLWSLFRSPEVLLLVIPRFSPCLVSSCFTPSGGTIILSEGQSSQQHSASPCENHTLLLVLLACGSWSSHTGLTGSCRWSSRIRIDGKNEAWRGSTGWVVKKTRAMNFKLWGMETH